MSGTMRSCLQAVPIKGRDKPCPYNHGGLRCAEAQPVWFSVLAGKTETSNDQGRIVDAGHILW
jgi:hypothetical protein